MVAASELPSVEQHYAPPDAREIVLQPEVIEAAAGRDDVLQKRSQRRLAPLAVAELVDQPPLRHLRSYLERSVESSIRAADAQTTIENNQRLANGINDVLRVSLDDFGGRFLGE